LRLQVGGDLYFAALQRNPQMLNGVLPDRLVSLLKGESGSWLSGAWRESASYY
jgi:hypothetical protein